MEAFILELIEFFKGFSYAGVIAALTFEFIPAEVVLPMVGYWVYQGDMTLIGAILSGSIGGVTGPLTLYFLGKYGGRPLVLKYGKYFLVREAQLQKAEKFFGKYGISLAFFGRFIPGIRTAISLPCGLIKMNVWKFSLYTFLAMVPITTLYVYVGYSLGRNWEEASTIVSQYLSYVMFFLLMGVGLYCAVRVYRKRKQQSSLTGHKKE